MCKRFNDFKQSKIFISFLLAFRCDNDNSWSSIEHKLCDIDSSSSCWVVTPKCLSFCRVLNEKLVSITFQHFTSFGRSFFSKYHFLLFVFATVLLLLFLCIYKGAMTSLWKWWTKSNLALNISRAHPFDTIDSKFIRQLSRSTMLEIRVGMLNIPFYVSNGENQLKWKKKKITNIQHQTTNE